jgi:hypothetical protein
VGRPAVPSQQGHARLDPYPAVVAGGRAAAGLCAELNPVEGLWSSLKAIELANLATPTLAEMMDQAHRGIQRIRRTPHLVDSFLRHAGLSVS